MTLESDEAKQIIKKFHSQAVRPVGITSLLYQKGLTGIRYEEALKMVKKEIQRIDDKYFKELN